MILLVAAHAAAQETIDVVCQGADRTYRIDGVENSDWEWFLVDDAGDTLTAPGFAWNDFADTDSDGNPIHGSEINILWNLDPGTYSLSVEQTSNYISVVDGTSFIHCVNHELGEVIVVPEPEAFAGDDILACASDNIFLGDATASSYSTLIWNTFGDGFFSDNNTLRPTYFPGEGDLAAGTVSLSLIAFGEGNAGSCEMAVSTVNITFSQPEIVLSADIPLCYGENSGTVSASASGGFGDYAYSWTGPGGFTADTSDISNLISGMYYIAVTDSLGCLAEDSIEVTQPEELLAEISPDPAAMCESDTIVFNVSPTGGTGAFTHLWTGPGAVYLSADNITSPEFRNAPPGNYQLIYTATDENACEAGDTVWVDVNPSYRDSVELFACENELPYIWQGQALSTPGFYSDTLQTVLGCDSILTAQFDVYPMYRDSVELFACENELPYIWQGQALSTPGFYSDTLQTVVG
jgi:hypothetical protein